MDNKSFVMQTFSWCRDRNKAGMIIELKYWEGVEEETVTILTFVLHYPSQLRQIVGPPTFVLTFGLYCDCSASYPCSLPACDVHIGSGNSLMYWSVTVWECPFRGIHGGWWWDSVMGEMYWNGTFRRNHWWLVVRQYGIYGYKYIRKHKTRKFRLHIGGWRGGQLQIYFDTQSNHN